jgi:glycosyltransferase involved in cell wall biosynthesis
MRLLFITGSLVHGGAERHTITLANRLAERGHECHLAYVKDDSSQLGRLRGAASVRCLHAQRYLDLGSLKQLAALMARVQPTSIVAVNQYPLLYATLARRWAGRTGANIAPLTVTFHTTFVQGAKEQLKMLYYRPLFWNADCLAFVCEAQRRHWMARMVSARRNEVIYNGVDLEHWRPGGAEERTAIRRAVGLADSDYAIGMCAVLRPEKNHLQLVDAVAALRRRGIPARALLIGDGPQRAAIEARACAAGIAADVVITGFQQDVRPFITACDVLAITSVTEALSLAAIEAMALGRPVVHSDVGGAAELIQPGRQGFLFPVGDHALLVDRLALLADADARRRMGARARETVEARFAERAMLDRYESLLQEIEIARSKRENLRRPAGAH